MQCKHLRDYHFKIKNFLKKEKINWSEILLLLALILLFLQSQYMKRVYNDPCSYCIIRYPNGDTITCKQAFTPNKIDINKINITISTQEDINYKNDR